MKLAIAESSAGIIYHLRKVGLEGLQLGGNAGTALCGIKLGWDTLIPISTWGMMDGHNRWCKECDKLFKEYLDG